MLTRSRRLLRIGKLPDRNPLVLDAHQERRRSVAAAEYVDSQVLGRHIGRRRPLTNVREVLWGRQYLRSGQLEMVRAANGQPEQASRNDGEHRLRVQIDLHLTLQLL